MVKASRSITLDIDTWKILEEMAKKTNKSISEYLEDLIKKEVRKSENG